MADALTKSLPRQALAKHRQYMWGTVFLSQPSISLSRLDGPRRRPIISSHHADIMVSIIECVKERVQKGARTFLVKVKAHRGEPLNELADTQAENARQLQDECRQWTVRTPSMTYEWSDNNGVKRSRRSDEQRALGEKVHAPTAGRRKLEQTDNHDLGS